MTMEKSSWYQAVVLTAAQDHLTAVDEGHPFMHATQRALELEGIKDVASIVMQGENMDNPTLTRYLLIVDRLQVVLQWSMSTKHVDNREAVQSVASKLKGDVKFRIREMKTTVKTMLARMRVDESRWLEYMLHNGGTNKENAT